MGFTELCIRRPVFATVLSLVLILVGLMSFSLLTIREYPNIDEPQVSVQTNYPGASAEIIESQVTEVLEGSLAGIEGIDTIEFDVACRAEPHHHPLPLHRRHRRRDQRRARPGEPRQAGAAGRDHRAHHLQGGGRRPAHHVPRHAVGEHECGRAHRLCRPLVVNCFRISTAWPMCTIVCERALCHARVDRYGAAGGQGLTAQDVEAAIPNQTAEIP